MLRSFFAKEEGQGLVEYALILSLIAIVVISIVWTLGQTVGANMYQEIYSNLEEVNS
jgi:pilus assembly protein Flp/PilA